MDQRTLTDAAEAASQALDARCVGWLQAMATGDEQALSALYDATLSKLFGVAISIVGDRALAEEVVTDTYHAAWTKAASFDRTIGKAMTWLASICRNRALDMLRREASASRRHETAAALEVPADSDEPDRLLTAMEDGNTVRRLLSELPSDDRQLVALAFFRGYSHQQIADVTELPLGTVKSRMRRALAQLAHAAPPDLSMG